MVTVTATLAFMIVTAVTRLPSTAIQMPSIVTLLPFRMLIVLAGTYAHPMAGNPGMLSAVPIPITRRPFVTAARRWNDFMPWWRRSCADDDIDVCLCHCFGRNKSGGTNDGDGCSSAKNTFHIDLQMKCVCSIYRVGATKQSLMHLLTSYTFATGSIARKWKNVIEKMDFLEATLLVRINCDWEMRLVSNCRM
jgi:hypothetical protein